jgi:spermidine/putrescine transport system permease protein
MRKMRFDFWNNALALSAFCAFGFLYLPIATLVLFSFNANNVTRLPLTGWTLEWYAKALSNSDLLTALWNSLIVAGATVIICLLIGVPTAFALDRFNFWGKSLFRRLVLLPITLPGIITGVSILSFLSTFKIPLSLWTVIVGHGTAFTAIVITSLFARLQRFDRRMEEASADAGARPWQTFVYITLPNIKTALIGSSLICFTLSFDEIPVTFFLTGRDNTLPMYIWSVVRRGITPEINAIGTIIVLTSIVIIFVSVLMVHENPKNR